MAVFMKKTSILKGKSDSKLLLDGKQTVIRRFFSIFSFILYTVFEVIFNFLCSITKMNSGEFSVFGGKSHFLLFWHIIFPPGKSDYFLFFCKGCSPFFSKNFGFRFFNSKLTPLRLSEWLSPQHDRGQSLYIVEKGCNQITIPWKLL